MKVLEQLCGEKDAGDVGGYRNFIAWRAAAFKRFGGEQFHSEECGRAGEVIWPWQELGDLSTGFWKPPVWKARVCQELG